MSVSGRLAVLALWLGAAGLPSSSNAQDLIARSFARAEGLANPPVCSLAEDREGFLWIGTWEGVSRFDGTAFTNYYEREGVPAGRTRAFFQGLDGQFYLGGDGGAAVFDGQRFHPLSRESALASGSVRAIAGLPDGTLLFGGQMGLVARRPGGHWETRLSPEAPPLSGSEVTALLVAQDGTLYLGTDHGAFGMRGAKIFSLAVKRDENLSREILALYEGTDGTLYAGSSDGLALLRGGAFEWVAFTRGQKIHSIAVSDDGKLLYLATDASGILRLRTDTLEPLAPIARQSGLSEKRVQAVHAVRGGPVFFGTDAGLDALDGEALETWTRAQGLPDDAEVWSLTEDVRGDIYAALSTGGAAVLRDGAWHRLGRREGLPPAGTISVHAGVSGLFYAGDDQGRIWISRQGRPLRIVELPERAKVKEILEGPGGVVYAATLAGFAVIQEREIRFYRLRDGLPGPRVHALALAPDRTLYLATNGGLAAFRDGAFRVWTREDGLPDDWIWSVRAGRDGSVHAGTRRGLAVLQGGRIRTYDTSNSLTNNFVACTLEDGEGHLYVSTNGGINVLGSRLPARARILPPHRLGSGTPNTGACLRDRHGRLWFSVDPVLTVFDPTKDHPRRQPRALLAGLHVFQDRQPLPSGTETKPFPYDRNDLTFFFTGIDLAAYSMRFRYRLAGLDTDWIETDQRSVRYPQLQPGAYRFEVEAVNDAGLRSAPVGLSLTILSPPWWRRPVWVLGLAASGLALAGGLFAGARVRQLLEVERLRASIAADLHDHVGAGLTDISILSEVAARKAGDLPELARIAGTARELVEGMGDIVWLINPRRDSLYELFLRLKDSYAELFDCTGAQLEVGDLSPFEGVRLPMAFRQDLHLLFKEALCNALRHSGCRRAELLVTLHGRQLEVELRDDGRGFDPERRNGHGEGLETMRRRAVRLGGRLILESTPAGTAVRFAGRL